jgi:phosphoserine phosphatase RsbU/P
VIYNSVTGSVHHLKASCVGLGMLDEIPRITKSEIVINEDSKLVCYTDGLSELKGENGKEIGTELIILHISNTRPVKSNIMEMISELGLPDDNPSTFDDVSIIVADLLK